MSLTTINKKLQLIPNLILRVCPTNFHLLIYGVDCDGSWLLQVLCDQGLPLAAVCRCHRDSLQNAVSPVDVAMDPIHRNALWGLNPTANYYSVVRGVTGHVYLGAVGMQTMVESLDITLSAIQLTSKSLAIIFIYFDWHLVKCSSRVIDTGFLLTHKSTGKILLKPEVSPPPP